MEFEPSKRIKDLPPYLFAELDRKKEERLKAGKDIIDLGVGDPDLPTPDRIIEALRIAAGNHKNWRYPSYTGLKRLRNAVSSWYQKRFDVELDPDREVIILIGSKEGIAHMPLACINPGDIALIPSPAYPVYKTGVLFAGGESYIMPLRWENDFIPDLESIPADVLKDAILMYLNYPNNPTSAPASRGFFEEAIKAAQEYGIIICHDAAYSEVYTGYERPESLLEARDAKEVGIEFHSLSKTYNMTGWRVGFAVGNASVISALGKVKTNVDSGLFQAIQVAAIEALEGDQGPVERMREVYGRRRELVERQLDEAKIKTFPSTVTFYVWAQVPKGISSEEFSLELLDSKGVVVTPGIGFGDEGEGCFRISLTIDDEQLAAAMERIAQYFNNIIENQ